jgi:5-methylcytosine-specific restriction protein A
MSAADLQKYLQEYFSLPFDVRKELYEGNECYFASPSNEENSLFEVKAYIQNEIRIVLEIKPQIHARAMLESISGADNEKKTNFINYLNSLKSKRVSVDLQVNGLPINNEELKNCTWNNFYCRLTRVPITDSNEPLDLFDVISEWTKQAICLFLCLLPVSDQEEQMGELEGSQYQVVCNKYERSPINRELCLAKKGYTCKICGFDFEKTYGSIGRRFIHVHHIVPVSMIGPNYQINPEEDLIPVCPNCHAMLHRKSPPFLPDEIKKNLEKERIKTE